MTPTENKTLVQNIMEARARRDPAPFIAAMADDFVWRIIGSTAWSGEYVGKTEVRERLLRPLYEQFAAPTSITASRILTDGDHVVVECQGDATTISGERYANTSCFVIRIAQGQLRELTEHMDTALVERVLKPPPPRRCRSRQGLTVDRPTVMRASPWARADAARRWPFAIGHPFAVKLDLGIDRGQGLGPAGDVFAHAAGVSRAMRGAWLAPRRPALQARFTPASA
jgi:ketosteroid isomerase-like protein